MSQAKQSDRTDGPLKKLGRGSGQSFHRQGPQTGGKGGWSGPGGNQRGQPQGSGGKRNGPGGGSRNQGGWSQSPDPNGDEAGGQRRGPRHPSVGQRGDRNRESFAEASALKPAWGRVGPDTAQYFEEIRQLIGPDGAVDDREERTLICERALEEAEGKELALACDPTTSQTLEGLLTMADAPQLVGFLERVAPSMSSLAQHPSGSHIADTVLQALAAQLPLEDPDLCIQLEAAIAGASDALLAGMPDLLSSRYATHVVRNHIALLGGGPAPPAGGAPRSHSHAHASASASARGTPGRPAPAPPFPHLLEAFARGLLEASARDMKALRFDAAAGPVFQAMLAALAAVKSTDLLIRTIALVLRAKRKDEGAAEDVTGEEDTATGPLALKIGGVLTLIRHRIGSHLFEAVVSVCPDAVFEQLWSVIQPHFADLAEDATANFGVQAILAAVRVPSQVAEMARALQSVLPRLLEGSRAAVVGALVAACGRQQAAQTQVCKMLLAALGGQETAAARLLAMGAPGSAILQGILHFPQDRSGAFVKSLLALSPVEIRKAAMDPSCARAVEAVLEGPVASKSKHLLVKRLVGHFAELALSRSGSFTVEKCFVAASADLQEAIVAELAAADDRLLQHPHTAALRAKCSVREYLRSPQGWQKRVRASNAALQEFAELFSGSSSHNKASEEAATMHKSIAKSNGQGGGSSDDRSQRLPKRQKT